MKKQKELCLSCIKYKSNTCQGIIPKDRDDYWCEDYCKSLRNEHNHRCPYIKKNCLDGCDKYIHYSTGINVVDEASYERWKKGELLYNIKSKQFESLENKITYKEHTETPEAFTTQIEYAGVKYFMLGYHQPKD